MEHEAEPDRAVLVTDPAKKYAGEDRGKCLGHRLLKMDHAVRYGHYQYRVKTERRFQTMYQKAAEEKFESEMKKIPKLKK